ncbi:MAG: hypothetical protein JXM69_13675 [Anaerolineae bacterium]|nr:hypothetical protein [Anaerolineae bacterium]
MVIEGNRLHFLSDYEVAVITSHFWHRRWLRRVARQMTAQLGVETSIAQPSLIANKSDSQVNYARLVQPTIAAYEVQSTGLTLYGEYLLNRGPTLDSRTVSISSGLRLMMNRMAEAMGHLPQTTKNWENLRWVNKTILSCAEALLTVHRQYHYSYAERGRRFAELVPQLEPAVGRTSCLPDLVRRATAFKLQPSLDLYPESMPILWQLVRQACDASFRYVIEKYLKFSFDGYVEFPERYLSQIVAQNKISKRQLWLLPAPLDEQLLLALEFLRARRRPSFRLTLSPTQSTYHIVFAVIPLLFLEDNIQVRREARRWLEMLGYLKPPYADDQTEQAYLSRCVVQAWKDFCYGKEL